MELSEIVASLRACDIALGDAARPLIQISQRQSATAARVFDLVRIARLLLKEEADVLLSVADLESKVAGITAPSVQGG
ncbi:hypothetical protein SH661x_001619 [Planctomicrobium sp. SH661]|uniref:hypothetical protein n=1 Tax=Planctomicrobium sp. SH661 TaxID=3448124 RepID=UPI003F5AEC1D